MRISTVFILLLSTILISCKNTEEEKTNTANVEIRVNAYANAPNASSVKIYKDQELLSYSDQPGQSTIALGEVPVDTHVIAEVISSSGIAGVDILIDNCFRDSDRCTEENCTARAEYTVKIEECPNY